MKLSGNQALNHFVAAATLSWSSNSNIFASARVGRKDLPMKAPLEGGFDPTAPDFVEIHDSGLLTRPGSESMDHVLEMVFENGEYHQKPTIIRNTHAHNTTLSSILRNMHVENTTSTTTTSRATEDHDLVDQIDFGILQDSAPAPVPSLHDTQQTNPTSSTCMIGFDKNELLPADTYLRQEIESGKFAFSQIFFDEKTNTIFCNQENDIDEDIGNHHHTYGCASMHFRGCQHVKCNGKESCTDTVIEGATTIECEGYEACRDATLDAITIDCGGEAACMNAIIGSQSNGFVETLDCHSGESACAYVETHSVGSVFCTGPLSCYGAELRGVTQSVTCQGVAHTHKYYMPTCGGGDAGVIEAELGHSIDVVCDGDFACIGAGPNNKDRPEYFEIDTGNEGLLTCGGSLVGNQDGSTFVCKFLDIVQGCSSYECKEPSFALADHAIGGMFDSRDLETCDKILSRAQDDICIGEIDDDGDDEDNEEER